MANSYISNTIFHLLFYYGLVCSCYFNKFSVYGAKAYYQLEDQEMNFLFPTSTRLTSTNKGPNEVQYQEKPETKSQQILLQHNYKLRSLKSLGGSMNYILGVRLPLTLKGDDFFATVGLGTPQQNFNLLFDTGSDLTWINCNNNSKNPFFNPFSSSTFSNNSCNTGSCNYNQKYIDGTGTNGYFASDTLTLSSNSYPNFIFGCAEEIQGFHGSDGLLGLGPGEKSLLAQRGIAFLSFFCYCLPATENSSGYIAFGEEAATTCLPEKSNMLPIPIQISPGLPNVKNPFADYSVILTGITIGGKRLEFSQLRVRIDSGTETTRLPYDIYSNLRSEFQCLMSLYPNTSSSDKLLDSCYNLVGYNDWTPPRMGFQFGGYYQELYVGLHPSAATFRDNGDPNKVCLAFAGNKKENDMVIIGNKQLRGISLFADIDGRSMTFGGIGC